MIRGENRNFFNIYRLIVFIYGIVYIIPNRRADNLRERNEIENIDWMGGSRDPKSPEISIHFSLFGYLRDGSIEWRDGDLYVVSIRRAENLREIILWLSERGSGE